jgi:CheY-like chemotaxis protein
VEVEALAKMMRRQMGQMVHLIDDLLDVSRINTGKIFLVRARADLDEILDAAVEAARPFIAGREHELVVRKSATPLAVDADRHRISQVISNLLSNAAKYTPPRGRIEVSTAAAGGMAEIRVADNGEGLSPEASERIFGMFEQIDPSRQDGLGIGLTLVKNLVELHGGAISVHSDGPGKGSEFTVLLPLAPPAETVAAAAPEAAAPPAKSSRVMVVEDGKSTAGVLEMFLRLEGMETCVAYDGEQAVLHARDFRPHLIFMDLGLPKKDGFQAAREIRAEHPDTILIAVSGWDRDEDRQRSAAAGFDGHAAKPVTPDGLRGFLRLLDSGRTRRV